MIVTDESKLRVVSEPVISIEEQDSIVGTLKEELAKHPTGIGLSAIQIGIPKRVFILRDGEDFVSFVNPVIQDQYDEVISSEGCLSFPGKFVTTKRFNYVVIKDDERTRILHGLLAIAAQHEMDHANGILFFDQKYSGMRKDKVVGRNDPCPCGSGKKYKKCCGGINEI